MIDLAISPLFAAMPDDARAAIAKRAVRKRAKRGQRIDAAIVVVVTGRLDVVGDGGIVRSLVPPATAGISRAAGAPATAELRAAEDTTYFAIPLDAVSASLERHPEAALAAIVHLGGVIGELSLEIEALRRHGLVERLRHRIAQLGRGRRELAITHERLAEEVGGTRANVSRALAQLEREGVLRRRRGRIELG